MYEIKKIDTNRKKKFKWPAIRFSASLMMSVPIKTRRRYHLTPVGVAVVKKRKVCGGCGGKGTPGALLGGM